AYVYVALDSGDGVDSQHSGAVVWRWTDRGIGSIGVEDKIEATYKSPIVSLEPGATRAGHLLIVHSDGGMALARGDLTKTFELSTTTPCLGRLIWYQLVDVSQSMRSYLDSRQVTDWLDGDIRLAITLCRGKDLDDTDKDMFSYYLSLLAVDGLGATITEVGTTRISPAYLRAPPLSCAFDADSGTVALLTQAASLRLQNNAKYYVDPVAQLTRERPAVHSSNILLREEQEQGLGVLRSGWEAIVDGTAGDMSGRGVADTVELFMKIGQRRENTQKEENEVLLALANVSDSVNSDQYTVLFMDHIGVALDPTLSVPTENPTWISAYLMTTVMRRCFVEPLGISRSSRLPLFAPRVIEFMLLNCGLCNSHAPAPGLIPHLLARVNENCSNLAKDQAWKLIGIALQHIPDIPEKHIVDTLKFQLSCYSEFIDCLFDIGLAQAAPVDRNSPSEEIEAVATDIKHVVSAVVAIKGSSDMLRLALSGLPLNHVVCLIRLLVIWLREWSRLGADVEIAASAAFVSNANPLLLGELYGLESSGELHGSDSNAIISGIIAQANSAIAAQQHEGVPSIDASMTLFKGPRGLSDDEGSGAAIVRVYTN
ncbi:hypothetical protein GGI11_005465, partial [Coemansia sp. RSA 2049]